MGNKKEISALEKQRKRIFKSKERCRKIFSKLPFDKKLKMSFQLSKRVKFLRKFEKI